MRTPVSLAALVALVLVGCGGDGEEPAGTAAGDQARQTFEIVLTEFRLEPSRLTIDEPGFYRFRAVNRGSTLHAFEIESEPDDDNGDFEAEIGELEPGESAELTVELARGLYEIECPLRDHDQRGMEGVLMVGGARAGATTDDGGSTDDGGYGP